METAQVEIDGIAEYTFGASQTLANPVPGTPPAQAEHFHSPRFEPTPAPSAKKRKSKANNKVSLENNTSPTPSVSNCYVFKSRLQEYAQKAGLTTPVYETIKEGPSHEPSFRSSVILNNIRYDSLPGFFNRKAAEQSAAEVALTELAKSVDMKFGISLPVHETGLCKNLLQEYAQKMNYATPLYQCRKDEQKGRASTYSCIVEIGGIRYVGGSASTKKEAEMKAAKTALLAIQSAASLSEDHSGNSVYTVIPHKKKVTDLGIGTQETAAALKPKKSRFKKQMWKKKRAAKRGNSGQGTIVGSLEVNKDGQDEVESGLSGVVNYQHKIADGLEDNVDGRVGTEVDATDVDGRAGTEVDATDVVSFQGTDSGHTFLETTMYNCDAGFYDENLENALVQFDGHCKDGGLTGTDVHP